MNLISFKAYKIVSKDDPETMSILVDYDVAKQVLGERFFERVTSLDRDVRVRLRKMVSHPQVLVDFIEVNKDSVLFEVYPAEFMLSVLDGDTITISKNDGDC